MACGDNIPLGNENLYMDLVQAGINGQDRVVADYFFQREKE